MMSGPWTAKEYINSYLQSEVPRRINSYRNLWNLDDIRLPTPDKYMAYEPPALDYWPLVITVNLSTPQILRTDYVDGMNPVYRVAYNMRTYVWVRQGSAELATESRDRLVTVLRAVLLDRPSLVAADDANHDILLDETTLREEYSDITYVKGDRAVCGAFLAYTLHLNEAVVRRNIFDPTEENPNTLDLETVVLPRVGD